jgi:hypothetical protein
VDADSNPATSNVVFVSLAAGNPMRLTLRTLLAHLDGVPLETGESGDLNKKIEESDFVRNLVQRIRTSISRPRLPAPKIDGQGLGHDPNTVAAYLDNTLPQDRMPDLEKICLESDVLLAEVAASHQILTLVLQNPVKAAPHLRDRIYRIGDLGKTVAPEAAAAKSAAAVQPAAAAPAEKPEPRKREIPEYLRETRSLGWKPLLLTVLAGFLLAAVVLRAMGPFDDPNHPVLGFFAGGPGEGDAVVQGNGNGDSPPQPVPTPAPNVQSADAKQDESGSENVSDQTVQPDTADKTPATVIPQTPEKTEQPESSGVTASPATDSGAATPAASETAGKTPAASAAPVDLASTSPTTDSPIPAPILADAPATAPADEGAAKAADLGRYISENEVLARYDYANNVWMRLAPNASLGFGEHLLAIPAYRPKLVLASGFQVTLGGGTLIELRSAEEPSMASIALEYGRIVVVPVGPAAGRVRLDCWGRQGEVTFAGPESIMAVQLRRYRAPGIDPEAGYAHRMVEIYAVRGNLVWNEPEHPEQSIQAGEALAFLDDARGGLVPTEIVPTWVENKDVDRTDELAAQDVHAAVGYELPLSRSLSELIEHRKVEVKALAARSLAYLDFFDALVDALNDETQKSYWDDHFNELQRALARDPQTAQDVRIAFEKIRGRPAAAEIYRLLWSYSPEDLAGGAAEKLVEHLMSSSLDIRVLAIQNLERITGMTHLYRPEVTDARRNTAYQRWRVSLADGKIKYNEMVLMLPPRVMEEPTPPAEPETPEAPGSPAETEAAEPERTE